MESCFAPPWILKRSLEKYVKKRYVTTPTFKRSKNC